MTKEPGKSINLELRLIDNGKGGLSLANKELNVFANVPVNSKLYKQLKTLLERSDRFTWSEGQATFIPPSEKETTE